MPEALLTTISSLAGKGVGKLFVGHGDAEFFVLFLKQLLRQEAAYYVLRKLVVAVIAALAAQLLPGLRQAVLIILIFVHRAFVTV